MEEAEERTEEDDKEGRTTKGRGRGKEEDVKARRKKTRAHRRGKRGG